MSDQEQTKTRTGLSALSSLNTTPSSQRRKTKLVATLGPATRGDDKVRALIQAGANVFRLNFSHGSYEEHLDALQSVRRVSAELGIPTAVLQDLSGPKIRISQVAGDVAVVDDDSKIILVKSAGELSTPNRLAVEGVEPATFLAPGEPVYLADGALTLQVESVRDSEVTCRVIKGGRIRSRVGIAFPESSVDLPATTDKDMRDLAWGVEHGVDFVAISFVQNAEDVHRLREAIVSSKGDSRIIAKIERRKALKEIDSIIAAADGIMVARGDLGLEIPLEKLPLVQEEIIEKCNYLGRPVIVATQMLHSMINSTRPTRAEVSDIASAVMSGADAVMLSDETAIGSYPTDAVTFLGKVAQEAERSFEFEEYKLRLRDVDRETVPDAVAYAACAAAVKLRAGAIVACTETGSSARLVAKYRPQQPLYGVSTQPRAVQRMSLYWGVIPVLLPPISSRLEEIEAGLRVIKELEHLDSGTRAIVTGGISAKAAGSTRIMEIREIE